MTCYRYRVKQDDFFVEVLDKDGIPMHYSTIVNRLNKQDEIITRLEKENEQLYELIDSANTLIAFKTPESCQKKWEKRLKELQK